MDYTKFLGKKEHVVLAYLGGAFVIGKGRRLRVEGERPGLGFHRFEVSGRTARALEAVTSPEMGDLAKARGHHVSGWLASPSRVDRLHLLPEEEPPPLAIVRARTWHSGDLLFESLDFDTEVEDEARLRLEQSASLTELKGVPATLRQAFGIALALKIAARQHLPLAVREAAGHATAIADGGEPVARELFVRIAHERNARAERDRLRALMSGEPIPAALRARGGTAPTLENAAMRAEAALDGAHARMLASRSLSQRQMEVTFEFMGERFISVVDAMTLQVYDSGVCLDGEDSLVTLDSLPGVIREAINTGRLVITRR